MAEDYPIKTCDYCDTSGKAYTWVSGETICHKCFMSFPQEPRLLRHEIYLQRSRIAEIEQRNRALVDALEYYADPNTYFAIGFMPDPPCGDFTNDFETVFDEYGLDSFKPGKKARQALKEAE